MTARTEQITGVVKHLTYVNPENGYFVAKVTVPGKGEKTVVGNTPVIHVGEELTASGSWQSSNWGPQFKASDVRLSAPTMNDAIVNYLADSIEGIGKGFAKKLVDAFGEDIFRVIEEDPGRLSGVPGIGKKRAMAVVEAYKEQKAVREIMVFLHKCGLSSARARRVYAVYKEDAIPKIRENPYVLSKDIWGIGFSTADEVARKQGIAPNSEYRVRAGLTHVLKEAEGQGSCGLPLSMVRERAFELLGVDYALIDRCIDLELLSVGLIKEDLDGQPCLFLPHNYHNEKYIAQALLRLNQTTPPRPIKDIDRAIAEAEASIGIQLEDVQKEAVRVALGSSVCVLTGGPGTGKTTITNVLLKVFQSHGLGDIKLAAPTGKAAKRASEATGFAGETVHRLLEFGKDGRFAFNETRKLDCDVLVVDEYSIMDVFLTASLLRAVELGTRLILVGDVDQLPSVGPGKILADIIDSGALPTVRLKTIFRQAASSDIKKNAHAINRGEMPAFGWQKGSDFCFTTFAPKDMQSEEDKKTCRNQIEAEVLRLARDMYKLGYDPIREVQVLAPMRKGVLGVDSLNLKLQKILNPHPAAVLETMGQTWAVGDKVMQLRNNYEKNVFNGTVGFIEDIDVAEKLLTIDFDGTRVTYKASELDELTLAYAFTIHKSQGSEFPVVIMPLDWSHYTMLRRNLFYTGVTRARKLCVVVGQPAAAKTAVSTAQNDDRYTTLKHRLREGLPAPLRSI